MLSLLTVWRWLIGNLLKLSRHWKAALKGQRLAYMAWAMPPIKDYSPVSQVSIPPSSSSSSSSSPPVSEHNS